VNPHPSLALRRTCPLSVALLTLLTLSFATPARAQVEQLCLSLNESAPGNEYLSVNVKGGLEGHAAYTIEAWIYPTSYAGFPTIVGNDYSVSYWLGLNTIGKVRFYPRGGLFVDTPTSVPLNRWTHVAAVYNSATGYTIYLNGQLELTGNTIVGAVGVSAGDLRIGADRESGGPAYFWRGYLDEVRIWNSARTGPQIRETMLTGCGRPSAFGSGVYDALEASWTVEGAAIPSMAEFGLTPVNVAAFVNGDISTHTTFDDPFGPPIAPGLALLVNGTDDHAVLPVTENFVRGVTVMAWVAPTNLSNFPTIAGRDFMTSFWLGITPTGRLRFYPRGGTPVDGVTEIVAFGRWTHVAATYDGTRTVLYVNGLVDRISTAVAGPVGANGRNVWIGADNGASGLGFPFAGTIDNVKIAQGALSQEAVREEMFLGLAGIVSPFNTLDQDGVSVSMYHVEFERGENLSIPGSAARLVRAGTAAVGYSMDVAAQDIHVFRTQVGGIGPVAANVQGFIDVPLAQTVADLQVFVSAPFTALENTRVFLRSPLGTDIDLVANGAGLGNDLLTVFDDKAAENLATSYAPYHTGIKPSEPLSTFYGQWAQGTWSLILLSDAPDIAGLWAWGLRINGVVVDAGPPGAPSTAALRLSGPNPVRGAATLAFDLARTASVDLALYDVTGRRVRSILAGERSSGTHRVGFGTDGLDSGIYFARLVVGGVQRHEVKITVLR
jgi:hypothetical protein